MKIIIAGSRDFTDYRMLKSVCNQFIIDHRQPREPITILSGGCRGADQLGERYARDRHYKLNRYLPDWTKYGPSAGPIRNTEMVNAADALVAFWDGKSAGTRDVIHKARRKAKTTNMLIKVVEV